MALSFDVAEPLLSVAQVAERLNCSTDLVYRLHESGQLPAVNVGRSKKRATLRFLPADVAEFVSSRRVSRENQAEVIRMATPARVSVKGRIRTRVR